MPSSLVLILWPASVFFSAVLSFRVGAWWRGIHRPGRHAFVRGRRHSDDGDDYMVEDEEYREDDAARMARRPALAPEGWMGDEASEPGEVYGESDADMVVEADTDRMEAPPAEGEHGRWWPGDEDTEILPRIQDIRPPMRATPIRRPPWVGKERREEDCDD